MNSATGELTREVIGQYYLAFMQDIRLRLEAMQVSVDEAVKNIGHSDNWKNAEFCYLQIRKVCELISVATLIAHNEFEPFRSGQLLKEWRAIDLTERLLRLNQHGFPRGAEIEVDAHGAGMHHIRPREQGLDATGLKTIYATCSDRLHVGSLRRIISQGAPKYDFREITAWNNALVTLLSVHIIFLPEIRSVLVTVLKDEQDGNVHCTFGDADGPAVLVEGTNLLEFEVDRKL